jgi:hypothetical protein
MKYLIVPTQNFSGALKGKKEPVFGDLPSVVHKFLKYFSGKVFAVLDESSWIKTTQAMTEDKKSQRCRMIKLLERYTHSRAILTGTLKSKSPMNMIDQYQFLSREFFPESPYAFAERYCVMTNLRTARGRRVIISQKDYTAIRKRMVNAYRFGGDPQLEASRVRITNEFGINEEKLDHIMVHKTYTPFLHQDELMRRVAHVTMTVEREDVFDIRKDKYIYEPIKRPVTIGKAAKKLANELIELGFTDQLVLGKAPALELVVRLQDICNGFEPIKDEETGTVTYRPLSENPKLDELEELLEEIDTDKNQVVVWCSRTNAFDSISERLDKMGVSHVRYSGSESKLAKEVSERLFASGEARVFLANQASAGYGLNCLRDANYMVWYVCGASVEHHHQAQHRLLRGQSKTPKFAYQIYVQKSVEERNIMALNVGQELLASSNTKDVFRFE